MGQSKGKLNSNPGPVNNGPIKVLPVRLCDRAECVPVPQVLHNEAHCAKLSPEKLTKYSKLGKISVTDIKGCNGLVLQGVFIPEELLAEIMDYIDYKSLIVCQMVCKQWMLTIRQIVWRRKAEKLLHCPMPLDKKALWPVFYAVCDKRIPFTKNLIRYDDDDQPRPYLSYWFDLEPQMGGGPWYLTKQHCRAPKNGAFFGNSPRYIVCGLRNKCWKRQIINLNYDGFPQYLLDTLKPTIKVCEWYRCRRDTPGIYECKIELVKLEDPAAVPVKYDNNPYLHEDTRARTRQLVRRNTGETTKCNDVVVDSYHFTRTFENKNHRGTWCKFKYQFKNYGEGVTGIKFYHGGKNCIEIAGTCITVEFPRKFKNNNRNV